MGRVGGLTTAPYCGKGETKLYEELNRTLSMPEIKPGLGFSGPDIHSHSHFVSEDASQEPRLLLLRSCSAVGPAKVALRDRPVCLSWPDLLNVGGGSQ